MTPKQMVMNLMKNNTNPMLSQLIDMANNGNINNIENMARQLFQQNGRSFDNEFNNFKGLKSKFKPFVLTKSRRSYIIFIVKSQKESFLWKLSENYIK